MGLATDVPMLHLCSLNASGEASKTNPRIGKLRRRDSSRKRKRRLPAFLVNCDYLCSKPDTEQEIATSGETSSHESSEELSQDVEALKEQKQGLFSLSTKDMKTSSDQRTLADYGVKQVAYSLGGALACILPSDLLELGGETDRSFKP